MIPIEASMTARWLNISEICVKMVEPRDPMRVLHYYRLLADHPDQATGPIAVARLGNGAYAIQDGHHRFLANVMAGRDRIAVVVVPGS